MRLSRAGRARSADAHKPFEEALDVLASQYPTGVTAGGPAPTPLEMPPPQRSQSSGVPIPAGVRALLEAPNFVHLSTLRKDGSPRNWIVWAGLEDEDVLICTD